jgi:S1-C subfamily serine protease
MRARLTLLSGSHRGDSVVLPIPRATIGRHPGADLRFGPDGDLEVSLEHAEVAARDGRLLLRDTGSSNGTFVNGRRLDGEHTLVRGDIVTFGEGGPMVAFTPEADADAATLVMHAFTRETTRIRNLFLLLIIGGTALAVGLLRRSANEREAQVERQLLLNRVDSLTVALRALPPEDSTFRAIVSGYSNSAALLRQSIAESDGGALDRWRGEVQATEARHRRLSEAAALDAGRMVRESGEALARVTAVFSGTSRRTGTGFAVRSDERGVWVATNRSLLRDTAGKAPVHLELTFGGRRQRLDATVAAVDSSFDLALLRVAAPGASIPAPRLSGGVPPEPGEPLVLLGAPGAAATRGVVARTLRGQIEVETYGAPGPGGSPVFDRRGDVVAVTWGTPSDSAGRIATALPIRLVRALLRQTGS